MTHLHAKFTNENPTSIVSHSTFCSLRPFWIVQPSARDRETCLCKLHENGNLVISKLCQLQMLPDGCRSVETCVDNAICIQGTRHCYKRNCANCTGNLRISLDEDTAQTSVEWCQWETIDEKRQIKGKEVTIKRTIRVQHMGTIQELYDLFQHLLDKLCWHVLVMRNQFREYRNILNIQSPNTCVIIVDYSENYTCKQRRAIQSAHFGASNSQVAMHTGVAYMKSSQMSFCSLSDCTRHDPSAIWASLLPVLRSLSDKDPNLQYIHFWSDGPVPQYRHKNNLLLASQLIYQEGFKGSTWNYFAAGHGKGAADAIGGVTKRSADRAVDHGTDILNASMMYDVLKKTTNVAVFTVSEDDVAAIDSLLPSVVRPVVGIMKTHQLQFVKPGTVSIRNLSCFCTAPSTCDCNETRHVTFPPIKANDSAISVTPVSTEVKGKKTGKKRGRPKNLIKDAETTAAGVDKTENNGSSRKKAGHTEENYFAHDVPRKRQKSSKPTLPPQRPPLPRQPTWLSRRRQGKLSFLV